MIFFLYASEEQDIVSKSTIDDLSDVNCWQLSTRFRDTRVSMFYVQTRDIWRDVGIVPQSHAIIPTTLFTHNL